MPNNLAELHANMTEVQEKVHEILVRAATAFEAGSGVKPNVVITPFMFPLGPSGRLLGLKQVYSDVDQISFGFLADPDA